MINRFMERMKTYAGVPCLLRASKKKNVLVVDWKTLTKTVQEQIKYDTCRETSVARPKSIQRNKPGKAVKTTPSCTGRLWLWQVL